MHIINTRIYIDPDFDEIVQFSEENWDTVRLCVMDDEPGWLCIASGYGHTHTTIIKAVRANLGTRTHFGDYILYHEGGKYFFNMCGETTHKNDERLTLKQVAPYFSDHINMQLADIIMQHHEKHRLG